MAEEGDEEHDHWGTGAEARSADDESTPSSPTFAPVGRPMVKKRFRTQRPASLHLDTSPSARISSLHNRYSVGVRHDLYPMCIWLTFPVESRSLDHRTRRQHQVP